MATFRLKALNECAEDNALREGAKDGAVVEGAILERPMVRVAVAELERNATENERQQHDDDREINRGNDDRKSERRKADISASPPSTSQVSLPSSSGWTRSSSRPGCAWIPIGRESHRNAHAQIEAVQEHIQKDAKPKHERPDGRRSRKGWVA